MKKSIIYLFVFFSYISKAQVGFQVLDNNLYTVPNVNIGLGTPFPSERLDIIGNARISGGLNSAGILVGGKVPGLSYPFSSESIGVVDPNLSLRLQSPQFIHFHTNINDTEPDSSTAKVRMTISPNGNVGVGILVPESRFHIKGNAGILNLEGQDHTYMQFFPDGFEAGRKGWFGYSNKDDNYLNISNQLSGLRFWTAEGEKMRILSNGNVGIGTINPELKLDVTGNMVTRGGNGKSNDMIRLAPEDPNVGLELRSGSSNGTPYIDFAKDASVDFDARIQLIDKNNLKIISDKFGISGRMTVDNGVIQRGGNPITKTSDLGLYSLVSRNWMRFVTNNARFSFYTDGDINPIGSTSRMTILENGRIGINTDSPSERLTVNGDLGVLGTTKISYLFPSLGNGSPYRFIRFGTPSAYYAGLMWNNNSNDYGDGDDFTIFTYNNRDIVLRTGNTAGVQIPLGEDVTLSKPGLLMLGKRTGVNLGVDQNEIQARNNGAVSTLYLNLEGGDVSIGRKDGTGTLYAKRLLNIGDHRNVQWRPSDGQIGYDNSSKRYKRNIKKLSVDFDVILKAIPTTYTRPWNPKRWEIGFLAEEFHELGMTPLVEYDEEGKPDGIRYDKAILYLVPILKEQKEQLEEKNDEINQLENRIDKLEKLYLNLVEKLENQSNPVIEKIKLTDIKLEQNQPNPFSINTKINLFLPDKIKKAALLITDTNGRLIFEKNISSRGKSSINIEANTLSAGTYYYSLKVDGTILETKKMILLDKS